MIALCFPLCVKRDFEEDFYQVEEGIWLSGRLFKCWIIVKEKSFATYYKKMINIKLLQKSMDHYENPNFMIIYNDKFLHFLNPKIVKIVQKYVR